MYSAGVNGAVILIWIIVVILVAATGWVGVLVYNWIT